MISIRQLAALSKVSPMTASKVMRGDTTVHQDLRKRVELMAEKMNYRPNELVRGIFHGKTKIIAHISSNFSLEVHAQRTQHIQELMRERDYMTLVFSSFGDPKRELQCFQDAIRYRVSGAIISPADKESTPEHFKELKQNNIPFVLVGNSCKTVKVPKVYGNDFEMGSQIASHLIDLGHRHIAYLLGSSGEPDRFLGSREKMKKSRCYHSKLVRRTDWTPSNAYRVTQTLKTEHPELTAILCANDEIAIGVLKALQDMHFRIPRDVSVAGFGNHGFSEFFSPSLTTTFRNQKDTAKTCVDALWELMKTPSGKHASSRSLHHELSGGELVIRKSTGPCPG